MLREVHELIAAYKKEFEMGEDPLNGDNIQEMLYAVDIMVRQSEGETTEIEDEFFQDFGNGITSMLILIDKHQKPDLYQLLVDEYTNEFSLSKTCLYTCKEVFHNAYLKFEFSTRDVSINIQGLAAAVKVHKLFHKLEVK